MGDVLAQSTALFHLEWHLLYKVGVQRWQKIPWPSAREPPNPLKLPAGCFQPVHRGRLGSKPVPDVIFTLGPILCSHVSN